MAQANGLFLSGVVNYTKIFLQLDKGHAFNSTSSTLAESEKEPQTDEGYTLTKLSQDEILVEFSNQSAANPPNWTANKKVYNAIVAFIVAVNSGISTALPSNAVPAIMQQFSQSGSELKVLPTALFLVGYIIGSMVFSTMSESIGRKPVLLGTFSVFVLATLACAFAPSWGAFLAFRAICGLAGAAPQTVVGGLYADMFFNERTRGRAMVTYMSAGSFGPILGPIISGCSVQYGWRWTFRISLIMTGTTWIALLFTSETFGPALLKQQACKLRKKWGNRYFSREELYPDSTFTTTQIIVRPITMLFTEPIILSTTLYIAIAYSLVFFYFQAYPIIFEGIYGLDVKSASLTYIPIGIGASSSGVITICYDMFYEKDKKLGKPWTSSPELHRLPLSCFSGPCLTISIFWLAWTAKSSIHWIVPVASGLVFGFGYQIVFTSLLTYVTDAYRIYSASALAASVVVRSIAGAFLPFTATPLYDSLGVSWATSVLGFVSLACLPIPFVLLYYGGEIRRNSPFCQRLVVVDEIEGREQV
ncbi:MFS multidrug transporter, putative [Talaromyces stipitatus ATCC 10500]|uniref:MFS multidrug transporter, putative n=1 Tax=Talaromyces stipitatus (strain ATCC 10500 / CBS 375.48 / QM 6759 / NRRL 1006) TaxID=441959 RepID=B8LT69_TALSN|nr:MFS multidrug transporter, putative [Talaromyces stipitatus ATCC 10500]EED23577.1 MFS multidrug transporter, putative [Talaromyces stipitatus ATCC 10500]